MKHILLLGAGKSAGYLADYLLSHADEDNFFLTVADANLAAAEEKAAGHHRAKPLAANLSDQHTVHRLVQETDLVISLLPPALHRMAAHACLAAGKHLITASYVDDEMQALSEQATGKNLLFLCEMGLDPGIDHMSAMKMLDQIKDEGGEITQFFSHCGGLVAPEHDDNPWHYKISWNPANIVNAGKAGAKFKQEGSYIKLEYEDLFREKRFVSVPGLEPLCWYPNRDSAQYEKIYRLEDATGFVRTTLRHPDFVYGWKNIIDLKLTDRKLVYETDGKSLAAWFREHMERMQFGPWLQEKLQQQLSATKTLLSELVNLVKLEEEAEEQGVKKVEEFMMVNETGDLQQVDIDHLKVSAAATLAERMHDANLTLKQLFFLGMDDEDTIINKGRCSAADILQFALEKKLGLGTGEKDMVVMLHEIHYQKKGQMRKRQSSMVLKGDEHFTAMAKTVGLPMGVAARLILKNQLPLKGVQIPVLPEIYNAVLPILENEAIKFQEVDSGI